MPEHIANPSRTAAILKRHGFTFKKSLGQNFLTNPTILQNIVDAAALTQADDVIEVGPGIGALTQFIAENAHHVLALEVDGRLLPVLAETLDGYLNVEVVLEDVLKADLPKLVQDHFDGQHALKVVANLPYYITTPILTHLMNSQLPFTSLTVMMQKEVANRLTAAPNSKDYGSLTIAIQQQMDVQVAFEVKRTNFVPAPNVDSAIVTLTRRAAPLVAVNNQTSFDKLTRGAFAARRKTLWNNLVNLYGKANRDALKQALETAEIDATMRAEDLSIAEFGRLSDALDAAGF
ncbi:16S rRNA (adenine(1518)-N(6)/adenine(1519)-N(6))-dimethyltransferase RsmA [Lacticaseibacillus sp. N501-2]|uniref:16S rRNA (adenine(1518)-N(6)/adenine(1519)-N(6))- dimethyltransferase RsmA n=1 Tax=Lacticaseibacillus salsurae TaxID=3367729 RepID=UPI0038B30B79